MTRFSTFATGTILFVASTGSAQDPLRPPFLEAVRPAGEEAERAENPFEDRIETDRDAFTPTPRLIRPGRLAIESAYSFIDNRRVKETHSFPELLLRYGLTSRVELRLGWNYEVGGESSSVSGSGAVEGFGLPEVVGERGSTEAGPSLVREAVLSYGAKIRLTEQSDWLPEAAVILMGRTPTRGTETLTHVVATGVVGWELPNRWKLDAALRYTTAASEGDRYGGWSPSAVLRVPVVDRAMVHAEYFGFFSQGRATDFRQQFLSAGASYLLTPDLEVGVRGGPGLTDDSPNWFINAGFGWRF